MYNLYKHGDFSCYVLSLSSLSSFSMASMNELVTSNRFFLLKLYLIKKMICDRCVVSQNITTPDRRAWKVQRGRGGWMFSGTTQKGKNQQTSCTIPQHTYQNNQTCRGLRARLAQSNFNKIIKNKLICHSGK